MKKIAFGLLTLLVLAGAGLVFLATVDIPPPSSDVRIVLPDDQFPQ